MIQLSEWSSSSEEKKKKHVESLKPKTKPSSSHPPHHGLVQSSCSSQSRRRAWNHARSFFTALLTVTAVLSKASLRAPGEAERPMELNFGGGTSLHPWDNRP